MTTKPEDPMLSAVTGLLESPPNSAAVARAWEIIQSGSGPALFTSCMIETKRRIEDRELAEFSLILRIEAILDIDVRVAVYLAARLYAKMGRNMRVHDRIICLITATDAPETAGVLAQLSAEGDLRPRDRKTIEAWASTTRKA